VCVSTLEQLQQNLAFNREAMAQLLVVSTLLGGFAMTGFVALITTGAPGRLRRVLALLLCLSTLAFIFGTALDALLQAGMRQSAAALDEETIHGLLRLGQVAVRGMLVGTVALVAALGAFGFTCSRRMGLATAALAALTASAFILGTLRFSELVH
jgi:hypothetical protein